GLNPSTRQTRQYICSKRWKVDITKKEEEKEDMATKISWTNETWNPVTGCSKVSPGCAHCYAERLSLRFGHSKKPWTPENAQENVVLHPERLEMPLHWKKPRMVFVNSMSDLFHELVPDEFIEA